LAALLDIQIMPEIKRILKIQYKLDKFFEITFNAFGFFCLPEQKIKYVCEKFLLSQPRFSELYLPCLPEQKIVKKSFFFYVKNRLSFCWESAYPNLTFLRLKFTCLVKFFSK
jgi:hypothetical protein